MRHFMPTGIVVGLLAVTWACAGTPGPGDTDYPFNLLGSYTGQVMLEGTAFSFGMEI